MLHDKIAVSGFASNDIAAAQKFYGHTLGLQTELNTMGILNVFVAGRETPIIIYPKTDHQPATYTVLNFQVNDIAAAVAELRDAGVTFEQYAGLTDHDGIAWGLKVNRGPNVAWFKDPAGNILSLLQNK